MAGFIENLKRSTFKITDSGIKFLATKPQVINLKILKTIPAYQERTGRLKEDENLEPENLQSEATQEEILENCYLTIRKNLAQELLLKIKSSLNRIY